MRHSNDLSVLILATCFLAATSCSDDGDSSASNPLQPQGGAAGSGAGAGGSPVAGAGGSPVAGAGGGAVAGTGGSAVAGTGGSSANAGAPGAAGVAGSAGAAGSDSGSDENLADAGAEPGGEEMPPAGPVAFSDVLDVLQTNCSPCHAMTGTFLPAFAQDDEAAAYEVTQQSNGDQFIYERIIARGVVERSMPPACSGGMLGAAACLSEEDAALLQAWVDQGAPP